MNCEEDCTETRDRAQHSRSGRVEELTLSTYDKFVAGSQTELIECEPVGDGLARLVGRAILATCPSNYASLYVRRGSRSAGLHDRICNWNVGAQSEITRTRDLAQDSNPGEWCDFHLIRLHVLQDFRRNSVFELGAQYTRQRQDGFSRKIYNAAGPHDQRVCARGVGKNCEKDSIPDLKISIVQSLSNCPCLQRISGLLGVGGRGGELIA